MFNIQFIFTTQWKHFKELDNLKLIGFDLIGKRNGIAIFAGLLGFTIHLHINLKQPKK